MKENPLNLVKLFGSDAKKIIQDYHECLKKQKKSNVDDFNDVVSLYGAVQDAFKALYNLYVTMYEQPKDPKFQKILDHIQKFDEYALERQVYNEKLQDERREAAEKKKKDEAEKEAVAKLARKRAREARQKRKPRARTDKSAMKLKKLDVGLTKKFNEENVEHKNLDLFKTWMREKHPDNAWPEKYTKVSALRPFLTKYLAEPVIQV